MFTGLGGGGPFGAPALALARRASLSSLNLVTRGNGSCSSSSSSYWWRRSGRIPRPCGSVRHGSLCKARKGGQFKLLNPESCGNE